jgi:hypothetical protein
MQLQRARERKKLTLSIKKTASSIFTLLSQMQGISINDYYFLNSKCPLGAATVITRRGRRTTQLRQVAGVRSSESLNRLL